MTVVSIRDVSKEYGGTSVFRGLSLTLEEGKTYGLTGPNGSGKSVLLKLICGFEFPDEGEVIVNPHFLSGKRTFPEKFGVTINGPAFLANATAQENLLQLARIRGVAGIDEVREVLARVGLDVGTKKRVRTFSLGMKQKLSIAQALLEKPEVLLLDEPFNALDESSVALLVSELRAEQAKGTTILFTSHQKEHVQQLCDEVFELADGKAKLVGVRAA